ncbi:MAG: EAL domain-containing response regulator [Rhodospirillales bacterium]|nr:EAL domain-containing response regulator [Rhodospirillales bacterium]MDP6883525.1 EAL domain-containing response regulator [Rhodospirillales bacterium]
MDDEPGICDVFQEVAEKIGFQVHLCNRAEEFVLAYETFQPTAIILDMVMGDVDGVELLRSLAHRQCAADILIISGIDTRLLATVRRLGTTHGLRMRESLGKPVHADELRTALRRCLRAPPTMTESDLGDAIELKQLVVHYQPKVNLLSSDALVVDSCEALVRWQHPLFGLLMPSSFIGLAERSGLIAPLTDLVLKLVVDQIGCWRQNGLNLPVAVNLAPQLLSHLDLPDRLADLLSRPKIEHSKLVLEITESAAMEDPVRTMDILSRCRLKQFTLSVDDFGTGYSSLVELHRMPFSELKIDRSLVVEVDHDEDAKIIVHSIVDLAHNLGLTVCAEGAEGPEAVTFLRSIGCEKVQGYFFSKPLAPSDFIDFVEQWNRD